MNIKTKIFLIAFAFSVLGLLILTTSKNDQSLAQVNSDLAVDVTSSTELAQLNKLTNPDQAEAASPAEWLNYGMGVAGVASSAYDLYCDIKEFADNGDKCKINNNNWSQGVVHNLAVNLPTQILCDQTLDGIKASTDKKCVTNTAVGLLRGNNKGQEYARDDTKGWLRPYSGAGLAQISSGTLYAFTTTEPPIPTNLALYFNKTFGDTIFGSNAYAASGAPGNLWEGVSLGLWMLVRNISLALFGLFLGIVGVMVMMRTKISPQAVLSVYSVLPMIPVSLAVILLGYPVVALMYSFIGDLNQLALGILLRLFDSSILAGLSNLLPDSSTGLAVVIIAAINSAPAIPSWILMGGVASALLVVGMLIAIVLGIIYAIILFAKVYISLIYTVVMSPAVGLVSIFPGKEKLILNLIKRVLVDVLTIPALIVQLGVGLAVIAYIPGPGGTAGLLGLGTEGILAAQFILFVVVVKFFIGLGIIFKAGFVRKTLEKSLGVESSLFSTGEARR